MVKIKVVGVCGTTLTRKAAKGPTNTEVLLRGIIDSAAEEPNVETDILWLAEDGFKEGCDQDNWCLLKQVEGKFCSKNDVMSREYYAKVLEADALVLATPVYIGGMSWLTAAFIHRLRALAEGKFYGFRARYGAALANKVLATAAVAWYRHGGIESTLFSSLYFTAGIFGMIPVTSGEDYRNPGAGYGAGGVSVGKLGQLANVKNDEYAMRTCKNLGKRVVEVARWIKAGQEAVGWKQPIYLK